MATKVTPQVINMSGSVNSIANTGGGGGTIYYVDMGGLKIAWGRAGSAVSNSAFYVFNLPAGFFSSTPSVAVSNYGSGGTLANSYVNQSGTTSISVYNYSGTVLASFIAIGT